MTTIINPRRINRTIIVERDSRTLTARVIDALDAPNGMAEMLADAEAARDDAQQAVTDAQVIKDGLLDDLSVTANTLAPGEPATAAWDGDTQLLTLGIPEGAPGDVSGMVRFDAPQTLTEPQKAQARDNIGAADSATATVNTRSITAGTGLTGGGNLTADRTIAADFASPAEALAGVATDKVMSPARVAEFVAALPAPTTAQYWQFTASGTWTKPAGLPDDTMVTVEMWGGGGGGGVNASGGGGGGGGYAVRRFRVSDLPSSVAITIGAGGAVNAAGSDTTFGSLLAAYRGGAGQNANAGKGGGGGGELSAGGNGNSSAVGVGGVIGGGSGGESLAPGQDARSIYGGGGGQGGDPTPTPTPRGGHAVYGGGGGGSTNSGVGGVSVYGGSGGDNGLPGNAPGGGGGRNAAGARGEVRIWI